jgi:hypothetical protein
MCFPSLNVSDLGKLDAHETYTERVIGQFIYEISFSSWIMGHRRSNISVEGRIVLYFVHLEASPMANYRGLCGLIVACGNIRLGDTVQLRGRIHLY